MAKTQPKKLDSSNTTPDEMLTANSSPQSKTLEESPKGMTGDTTGLLEDNSISGDQGILAPPKKLDSSITSQSEILDELPKGMTGDSTGLLEDTQGLLDNEEQETLAATSNYYHVDAPPPPEDLVMTTGTFYVDIEKLPEDDNLLKVTLHRYHPNNWVMIEGYDKTRFKIRRQIGYSLKGEPLYSAESVSEEAGVKLPVVYEHHITPTYGMTGFNR